MEKQLKVVFLGVRPSIEGIEYFPSVGLRRFTVGLEMALDIIRNSHKGSLSNEEVPGLPPPDSESEVMLGGRIFPGFPRKEVVQSIKDIDLLVVSGDGVHQLYLRALLAYIDPEMLNKCTIVLRMPDETGKRSTATPADILKNMGMNENGETIGNKKMKKKNKKASSNNRTIFIIGLEEYGGCPPEDAIPLLQAHLLQDGIVEQLVQPVKETVSAGKSLFNLGSTFTGWLSRLVKTN